MVATSECTPDRYRVPASSLRQHCGYTGHTHPQRVHPRELCGDVLLCSQHACQHERMALTRGLPPKKLACRPHTPMIMIVMQQDTEELNKRSNSARCCGTTIYASAQHREAVSSARQAASKQPRSVAARDELPCPSRAPSDAPWGPCERASRI